MIKHTLLLFYLLASFSLAAQRMELSGGVNTNVFYDNGGSGGQYSSEYTSHTGYAILLGVDEVMVSKWEFRFTLGYEKYGGGLYASEENLDVSYITEAEADKSVLSLGFFPVNFKIIDKIDLSIGVEGSRLLDESFEGTDTNWNMGSLEGVFNIEDQYDRYSAQYYIGLQGRVGYEFRLSDRVMLVPQYTFYYGLSHEFEQFPEETKSMRHFLGIGLTWDLTHTEGIIPK